jgi:hypothetical protein
MNKSFLKSIVAVIAGLASSAIFSIVTDALLEQTGFMKKERFDDNASWIIVAVILYRTVYNIAGCYLTSRLAPNRPMLHAMIIGVIGFVLTIAGTVAMWDKPPHWYPLTLIILTLPAAWLAGWLAEQKNQQIATIKTK